MAETDIYAWPLPDLDAAPAGPYAFEQLATGVEGTVQGIDTRLATAEGDVAELADALPRGLVSHLEDDVTSTGLAGPAVKLDQVAVSLKAGRHYRIRFATDVRSTVTFLPLTCQTLLSGPGDTSPTGTVLESITAYTGPVVNAWANVNWETVYTPVADETVNIKAVTARSAGTASYDVSSRRLSIIDEGKAY